MIIWAYNLPRQIVYELTVKYSNVRFIENTEGMMNYIQPNDKIICMWDDGPTLQRIRSLENETYPSRDIIEFAANRERMTKFVDKHSQFPAERIYFKLPGEQKEIMVPRLNNSLRVVAKVGEEHKGQDKFLLYPGQNIFVKDSVIFEEFVHDALSFRILLIGEEVFIIEYHDDPYNPKVEAQHWIKNINTLLKENPSYDGFMKVISDTHHMVKELGWDYVGVDYVRNEDKTVCLELNTFPGIRVNENTIKAGIKYWDKVILSMGGKN